MNQTPVPKCPDTCPECNADLRSDGYPIQHQDPDGQVCAFTWAPGGPHSYHEDLN